MAIISADYRPRAVSNRARVRVAANANANANAAFNFSSRAKQQKGPTSEPNEKTTNQALQLKERRPRQIVSAPSQAAGLRGPCQAAWQAEFGKLAVRVDSVREQLIICLPLKLRQARPKALVSLAIVAKFLRQRRSSRTV